MIKLSGHTIIEGISEGCIKTCIHDFNREYLNAANINPASETKRFEDAVKDTLLILENECRKIQNEKSDSDISRSETDDALLKILEAYHLILEDEVYLNLVKNYILRSSLSAEKSLLNARDYYINILSQNDDVFSSRTNDMYDLTDRLIQALPDGKPEIISDNNSDNNSNNNNNNTANNNNCFGSNNSDYNGDKNNQTGDNENFEEAKVILLTDSLTVSDILKFERGAIAGIISEKDSRYSHAAVLAKSMNIPMITGIKPDMLKDIENIENRYVLLDGFEGEIIFEPDEETVKNAESRKQMFRNPKIKSSSSSIESEEKSDRIKIYANINCAEEADYALKCGAEGIGLFRTEYLFMGKKLPSEEEQFEIYKSILLKMNNLPVVIRTADIGGDKKVSFFDFKEENPAMGLRGIRLCLKYPDFFKTQLRSLFRAGVYGNLSVMFPMISSLKETDVIFEIIEKVKDELSKERKEYSKEIKIGFMIETPAAVMIAEELAKKADFFSVGSNDLTQYTLAMDRTNPYLEEYFDANHPAVLKMIEKTAEAAKNNKTEIGICGELASDTSFTEEFIRMGINVLSVSISALEKLKQKRDED